MTTYFQVYKEDYDKFITYLRDNQIFYSVDSDFTKTGGWCIIKLDSSRRKIVAAEKYLDSIY